jgi:hypothetical protein
MTSTTMDAERLQNLEARLREQAEATRATNELITQLFSMMKTRNVDGNIATPPSPSVSLPLLATSTGRGVLHPSQLGSVSHSPRIKPVSPDNFNGDRSKGRAFLTSCKLYLSLTGPDYPDEQSHIHWALLFFKSGRAATFAERTVRQEMRTGVWPSRTGQISPRNSCLPSSQRMRQWPRSCASSRTATFKDSEM